MDSDPHDKEVPIKNEPKEGEFSKLSESGTKPILTKGGVKKRTFAPKASVRKVKPDPLDSEASIKKEKDGFKREWKDRDGSRGRGRGRGQGRGAGRGMITMQASGPFSMGPAGLGSSFKKAQAIFRSGGSGGGGGGGGGGGHGGYNSSHRSSKSGGGFSAYAEDESREEYEDADIMTHYEGGEDIKDDPEVTTKVQTKEEIKAEEMARQLQGLVLSSDKLTVFADSLDAAKSENAQENNTISDETIKVKKEKTDDNTEVALEESTIPETESINEKSNKLPEEQHGHAGKLRFFRSGKVELTFGDIVFDVTNGIPCDFYQEAVVLDKVRQYVCALGTIKHRFICSPNIESLLGSTPNPDIAQ